MLPDKNLGEIHGRILAIFWLLGIPLPGENLKGIGPQGIKMPAAKILSESQLDSCQDWGGMPSRS